MNEEFVIVTKATRAYGKDTGFRHAESEHQAIAFIMSLSLSGDSDISVERVFKVDEYGVVTHYEMVVKNFRPALNVIPEVARG